MKTKEELLQMLFAKLEEGNFTKEEIETAAHLPEDYSVGTYTRDESFWYKVVEV